MSTHPLRIGEKLLQTSRISRYQLRQALTLQQQEPERLGNLLIRLGYLPEAELARAQMAPAAEASLRLGDVLLGKGWLSPELLDAALSEQRRSEDELGALLVRKGWLSADRLERALTELLLQRAPSRRRRLGQILAQTRQISPWQLNVALQLRAALEQNAAHEPLGELLVRLNWLSPAQLNQALRLQKRLLRSTASLFLGATVLVSCKAPTVPLQFTGAGDMYRVAQTQPLSQTALNGPFKVLTVDTDTAHQVKIRVYQNGGRVIENVPFFRQGNDNTCGQAVIAMVTNFWGIRTDYQEIVNQENAANLATLAGRLTGSLREKGLQAQDFREASLDNLIAEINKGRPTPVLLDFGNIQSAHYVVVLGYNPLRGTLIMHDSLEAPYVEMAQQTFLKMWENKSLRNIMPVGGENYKRLMFQSFHANLP